MGKEMIEKKRSYNETHPELEEGERFLTNCVQDTYDSIGWKTKRWGRHAYTIEGEPLTGYIPVFVQRSEYEEGMKRNE
jgi:hypothetical protein